MLAAVEQLHFAFHKASNTCKGDQLFLERSSKIQACMEPWFSVKPERTISSWDHFIRGIVSKLLNVCPDQPQ